MTAFISKTHYKKLTGITGFLIILAIWAYFSRGANPLILPSPRETYRALLDLVNTGELQKNLVITVRRTLTGYGLALISGLCTALILYKNILLRRILRPLITVIQTTPPVIWIALAVIWFGIAEDLTPIFLIFVVTFPVIFVNVFSGLQDMNRELIDMANVYNWSRKQKLINIYFPALIPYFVSSLSIGFAFAWKSTVFAEFIGSSSGVGFALSMANNNLQTDRLFAWAIVLVLIMLFIEYLLITPLQKKVTGWKVNE